MASKNQPEKGSSKSYQARYRISTDPCSGVDKSHDRSTLPHNALVEGINARVHDGIVLSRGGQSVTTDEAVA